MPAILGTTERFFQALAVFPTDPANGTPGVAGVLAGGIALWPTDIRLAECAVIPHGWVLTGLSIGGNALGVSRLLTIPKEAQLSGRCGFVVERMGNPGILSLDPSIARAQPILRPLFINNFCFLVYILIFISHVVFSYNIDSSKFHSFLYFFFPWWPKRVHTIPNWIFHEIGTALSTRRAYYRGGLAAEWGSAPQSDGQYT